MQQFRQGYDDLGGDYSNGRPGLSPSDLARIQSALGSSQQDQASPDPVAANQNNYSLPDGDLIRLSASAPVTFSGFAGARPGIFVVCNVGAQNITLAHLSGSSAAENRVLCHTGANITLNANESVPIIYDFSTRVWRTIGFA